MRRLGKKGFTLVEIMIVVAIIILLAAIAIPNLLRARHNANEAAAIGALRTLSTAMESFRAAQTMPSYAGALNTLSGATPPYIDSALGGGSKQGYDYAYVGTTTANQYTLAASPVTTGVTGTRVFRIDESGVVMAGAAVATATTPVQ